MKNKYWLTVILLIAFVTGYGQDVRVNNSFVILINDKLTTSVAALRLILSDTIGNDELINGGYYPGVLYVGNVETKNILYADSVRKLTLSFDNYEYRGNKQFVNHYKVVIDRKWFKQSVIILRIIDVSKKREAYKYSFEVPGYSFGKIVKK